VVCGIDNPSWRLAVLAVMAVLLLELLQQRSSGPEPAHRRWRVVPHPAGAKERTIGPCVLLNSTFIVAARQSSLHSMCLIAPLVSRSEVSTLHDVVFSYACFPRRRCRRGSGSYRGNDAHVPEGRARGMYDAAPQAMSACVHPGLVM
jgi:hypothetical protein